MQRWSIYKLLLSLPLFLKGIIQMNEWWWSKQAQINLSFEQHVRSVNKQALAQPCSYSEWACCWPGMHHWDLKGKKGGINLSPMCPPNLAVQYQTRVSDQRGGAIVVCWNIIIPFQISCLTSTKLWIFYLVLGDQDVGRGKEVVVVLCWYNAPQLHCLRFLARTVQVGLGHGASETGDHGWLQHFSNTISTRLYKGTINIFFVNWQVYSVCLSVALAKENSQYIS